MRGPHHLWCSANLSLQADQWRRSSLTHRLEQANALSLLFVSIQTFKKVIKKAVSQFSHNVHELDFLLRPIFDPSILNTIYIKERDNKFPILWVWYWEDIDEWKK